MLKNILPSAHLQVNETRHNHVSNLPLLNLDVNLTSKKIIICPNKEGMLKSRRDHVTTFSITFSESSGVVILRRNVHVYKFQLRDVINMS